mgnify:CR=1 FL=1
MSRISANAKVSVEPMAKLRPYPERPNGAISNAKIPLEKKNTNEIHAAPFWSSKYSNNKVKTRTIAFEKAPIVVIWKILIIAAGNAR